MVELEKVVRIILGQMDVVMGEQVGPVEKVWILRVQQHMSSINNLFLNM